ncbi:fimbrial protein [Pseudomonas sp. GM80]|uniref:fimbrial protein n=1 Tax=Pseudomonas sp. GM80 TaxID=1144339 RepID=UPI00026FC09C|nr:fimbrial protein [Pseudomonas sp. GM80]EJN21108.1 P pilus assembly protein, pilin FimA [Pseudomonas sp. GM80]
MSKSTLFFAFFILIFPIYANSAICSFYKDHAMTTFDVSVPSTLSIPRDTPNGTVVYESPPVTLNSINSSYTCTANSVSGIKNNVGESGKDKLLPIGNTGLAWSWKYKGIRVNAFPVDISVKGTYGFNGTTHSLVIVKTANITNAQKIPSGILGYYQIGEVSALAMSIQGMTILPQSCETPDVKVDMGENDLSQFSEFGKHTDPVGFTVKVNNCPRGINKITYTLSPTPNSPEVSAGSGVVSLNQNSTAKGIALQLLDSNQFPIEFNKAYLFSGYSTEGGNYNIPLNAQYIRTVPTGNQGGLDPGMRAGSANAEIWFIMSYL